MMFSRCIHVVTNKTNKQNTQTTVWGYQRGGGAVRGQGGQSMVMEDLTLGGEHTTQHTDDAS